MKTEEIKPGGILFDKERNMLVKVARVDEDGVVKYSAYTDMQRIFKTVPPPYRIGTRTADAYVPATDEQRKYMERKLAVCEYINLPKNNRMETLAYIIADLKAENMELEQRVHQLVDDYNEVVCQLNINEKRNGKDSSKQAIDEMQQIREHCDHTEGMNNGLDRFVKAMHKFVIDKNLYVKKDNECPYRPGCIRAGSLRCLGCNSCLSVIDGHGVICEKRLKRANVFLVCD